MTDVGASELYIFLAIVAALIGAVLPPDGQ